jgi:hypothetical protein
MAVGSVLGAIFGAIGKMSEAKKLRQNNGALNTVKFSAGTK